LKNPSRTGTIAKSMVMQRHEPATAIALRAIGSAIGKPWADRGWLNGVTVKKRALMVQ
jgi:hypothetical protein